MLLGACSKDKVDTAPQVVAAAPSHSAAPTPVASAAPEGGRKRERVVLEEIGVPDAPSEISVHFGIPKGTTVNGDAPFRIRWKSSEALENAPDDVAAKGAGHENGFRISLRPARGAKVARLLGEVELVVCDAETHSICIPVKREVDLTFMVGGAAAPKPVELKLPSANG
jgi:hypothetical protein